MAAWRATIEPVATLDYRGLTVCKTLPWAPGPVGLQQLALLEGFDLAELSAAEFVHVVTECGKLAFADRDALYGDSPTSRSRLFSRPSTTTSGARSSATRRRPSATGARTPADARRHVTAVTPASGEPTRGDTVHLDVVDRFGNMISATPSGGWLQSSPVIPALGWPLGTRAQMFWLEEGLPSSLSPDASAHDAVPGLALRDGEPYLAWGTPGGDQQEQWAMHVFLRHVDLGMNLQEAIDAPEFHTDHLISSFFPRGFVPKSLALESRFDSRTVPTCSAAATTVTLWPAWSLGRVTAVAREPDGLLRAGANPRGMQGYAVGR